MLNNYDFQFNIFFNQLTNLTKLTNQKKLTRRVFGDSV